MKMMNKLKCSQNVAIWMNGIMVAMNIITALLCITMYAHSGGRRLILSLQELIQFHSAVIGLFIVSILAVTIGIFTLRALLKSLELYVSVEIFGLIFLITLKAGFLFAIIYEWTSNLETGVTFSVQKFNPSDPLGDHTMEGIQLALGCCGRDGAVDYEISNDAIAPFFVPISCCDRSRYMLSYCKKMMGTNDSLKLYQESIDTFRVPIKTPYQYVIPIDYASKFGCAEELEKIVFRGLIGIYVGLSFIEIICIVCSSIFVRYASQACEMETASLTCTNTNKDERSVSPKPREPPIASFDQITEDYYNDNNLVQRVKVSLPQKI